MSWFTKKKETPTFCMSLDEAQEFLTKANAIFRHLSEVGVRVGDSFILDPYDPDKSNRFWAKYGAALRLVEEAVRKEQFERNKERRTELLSALTALVPPKESA